VHHPGVLCGAYLALAHCALVHDEEAEARIGAALQLARDSGNPFNEALALLVTAQIAYRRDRPDIARRMIDEVFERDVLVGFGPIRYLAGATRAWADARLGRPEGAAARLRRVLADLSSDGWRLSRTYHLTLLAEVLLITGDIEGALTAVDDGLAEVEATGERLSEAGLCLLRGELSVADEPGNPSAAEAWFRRALAVAESQQAVPLQRRAAAALARLPTPEPNRTA
ncbi:MAG: hypothetical protein ACRDY5_04310, partial [Acidimicrobiales bacterium]